MSLASMASVDYLVGHVAAGDGRGQQSAGQGSPLTRYYTADGYPPGRSLGVRVAALAAGRGIPAGADFTEPELRALFEDGAVPDPGRADRTAGSPVVRRAPGTTGGRPGGADRGDPGRVVDRAAALSVLISAPQVASVPDRFLDPVTGLSRFAQPPLYTSQAVLAAEDPSVGLVPGHRRPSSWTRRWRCGSHRRGCPGGMTVGPGGSGASGGDRHDVGPGARRAGRPGRDREDHQDGRGLGDLGRPSTGPGSVRGLAPVGAGCAGPRR